MEKLVLIDGNSLINRAFYATPVFTTKDGLPTNGIFGFIKLMLKIITDKKPTYFSVAFDVHAPTFRHKAYADYKAGRKPMPQELSVQIPLLKEILKLMNVNVQELAGFEADDIIGTIAKKFPVQTFIYTGDRDAYQLVDDTTNVCFTKRGVSDLLELTAENFKDNIGLTPSQIIDLKSLMGDSSDHIPGVPGIGEKTAYSLLEKYATLTGIYEHIDEIKGAVQTKLIAGIESAFLSYILATINVESPLDIKLSDCVLKNSYPQAVRSKFATLEFKSLLNLSVFEEEQAEQTVAEQEDGAVEEKFPKTIAEGVNEIKSFSGDSIACVFSQT